VALALISVFGCWLLWHLFYCKGLLYCNWAGAEQFPVPLGQRFIVIIYVCAECAFACGCSFTVCSVLGVLFSFLFLFILLFIIIIVYYCSSFCYFLIVPGSLWWVLGLGLGMAGGIAQAFGVLLLYLGLGSAASFFVVYYIILNLIPVG